MTSLSPEERDLFLTQIDFKLNSAAESFGLNLPKPAGPINKEKSCGHEVLDVSHREDFRRNENQDNFANSMKSPYRTQGDYSFETKAKESYRFFIIRDRWAMLEREMKMVDIEHPFPLVRMPLITLKQLKQHLHDKFGPKNSSDLLTHITNESVHLLKDKIDGFIAEVHQNRILGIRTVVSDSEESNQEKSPFKISFATFSGLILQFSHPQLVPKPLRDILSDVAYAKIASKPDYEGQHLTKIGIRLRGWIHSGAVYRALLNYSHHFEITDQANFLVTEGFVDGAPRHSFSGTEGISAENPLSENVWAPIAVVLASALNFAVKRGYPDDKQMFPVIWEAIDLVRCKVAEDLENISPDPILNWMVGYFYGDHQTVNLSNELLKFRRMRADFVEVFDPAYDAREAAKVAKGFYMDPPKARPFPKSHLVRVKKGASYFDGFCISCEKNQPQFCTCPKSGNDGQLCQYPLYHTQDMLPHNVSFCPVLHRYCRHCATRGHNLVDHQRGEFTVREMREIFFQHAHQGIYTCIPFLVLVPNLSEKVTFFSRHWSFGYQSLLFRSDPITRYQLGIDGKNVLELSKLFFRDNTRAKLVGLKLELIRKNAEADNLEDFRPVPKLQSDLLT